LNIRYEKKKPLVNHRPYDHSFAWGVCNAIVLYKGGI